MWGTPRSLYDRIDRNSASVAVANRLEINDLTLCRRGDKPTTSASPRAKACFLRMSAKGEWRHGRIAEAKHYATPPRRMRKREREKILGKLSQDSEVKHGHSVHVRPYYSDGEKLDQIARETGEVKAAIVRRMIRFALSDKQQNFAANVCRDKLDWLIKNGREEAARSVGFDPRIDEIVERIRSLETGLETVTDTMRKLPFFMREIYCLSNISFSSQNLIFTRLLEFVSPSTEERKQSGIIAAGTLANQIAHAIKDLNKLEAFHKIDFGPDQPDELYLMTKINAIRDLIAAYPPTTPDEKAVKE